MNIEAVSAKDMEVMRAIAETSEELLRTDKAVHDGFMESVEMHTLPFDKLVQIIGEMKNYTKVMGKSDKSKAST